VGRPEYDKLVSALSKASAEFKRMWAEQRTEPLSNTRNFFLWHPELGKLSLSTVRLMFDGFDGFVAFIVPADEQTSALLADAGAPAPRSRASTRRPHQRRRTG
jgi:hypothetical protein